MMANKTECIDAARKALYLFTGEELEDYIRAVSNRAKELEGEGVPFSRDAAIKEINNEQLSHLLNKSNTAAMNMSKFETAKKKIDSGINRDALLEKKSKNTDYNVETAQHAAKQKLHDDSFDTLTKEHFDLLIDKELDDAIFAYADGVDSDNPMVKEIGDKLKAYSDNRNAKLIKSNAMQPEEINKDRFFRNTYNQSKLLKMGKEAFVMKMKQLIDIKETFKNTRAMSIEGNLNDDIVEQMIGTTYDNIIKGNGVLFTKASIAKDWEKIERSRHMFYKFKDWKSWGIGDKEFGQESLFKSWLMDINHSANQIGMAEIFGSAPEMMYNELRKIELEKSPNTVKTSIKSSQTDALFKQMLGINKSVYNPTIANIGSAVRQISSMARLFKIAARSIPDLANVAGMNMRAGVGYWKPLLNSMYNIFDLMDSESRRILAKQFGSSLNTNMGIISRYSDLSGMGNMIDRISNKFFHGVGLEALDRGNKLSAMEPVMKGYGRDSNKSFERLNTQQQSFLKRFNISEMEWDALRAKTQKNFFSLDNVNNMTRDEIKSLWEQGDKSVPLSEYDGALYRKVYGMFDTMQEFSVLNPTAYSKMIMTSNTMPGTIHGEAVRMFTQFKAYPIQYMRRVWKGGMQDFDSAQARMMYGLNMMLATVMLTTLADGLISISNGLTPADPTKMSKGEAAKYYIKMMAGGMGVFGTILNDKVNLKSFASAMIATPSVRLMGEPLMTAIALSHGDVKGAKNAVRDFVNVANPISTAYVLSPFIDSFLGNKPYIEPGQHSLF